MILAQESQSPPACLELILHIICLIARPPCNETTDLLLPLCPQTCNAYEKLLFTGLCDDFLASIINLLEPNSWYSRYLIVINCSDPAPLIQNAPSEGCESSSSCTNLFNPETEGIIVYAAMQMWKFDILQHKSWEMSHFIGIYYNISLCALHKGIYRNYCFSAYLSSISFCIQFPYTPLTNTLMLI